jgi:hypothetical protein
MLKRTVNYEDFNGNNVSEDFYFNLTKAELLELELSYDSGFAESLQRIIDAKDNKTLVFEFKKLVLLSYGIKSEDGKRFMKSDKIREEFEQTAAYSALFMELAVDATSASAFITGITPRDLVDQARTQDKPVGPPPAPLSAPPAFPSDVPSLPSNGISFES